MTTLETTQRPAHPCTEFRDPEHGKVYLDSRGLAWSVDSRRLPELDGPPALDRKLSAVECARALAGQYAAVVGQFQTGLRGERGGQ